MTAPALSQRIAARLESMSRENGYMPNYTTDGWREVFESEDRIAAAEVAAQAKSLGLDTLRREVAQLRREVAELNRFKKATIKHVQDGVKASNNNWKHQVDAEKQLFARVEALEQRPAALSYRGVWSEAVNYQADSLVTHGGSGWIAQIESKGIRPGDGSAWRLAIKGDVAELRRVVSAEVAKQIKGNPACR